MYLGLDSERSWIIATDLNVFALPGVDIRPVPRAPAGTFDYGVLPPALHRQLVELIVLAGTLATSRSE
jgi:hypothetical protein